MGATHAGAGPPASAVVAVVGGSWTEVMTRAGGRTTRPRPGGTAAWGASERAGSRRSGRQSTGGARRGHRCSDRGFATAEVAVALPSLLLVSLALIWVVGLVTAQLECVDAARAGARAVSRGESFADSEAAALEAAPDGATVSITRSGDFIRVEVQVSVEPAAGLLGLVPAVTVNGVAHALSEDAIGSGAHELSIPVDGRTGSALGESGTARAGPSRMAVAA